MPTQCVYMKPYLLTKVCQNIWRRYIHHVDVSQDASIHSESSLNFARIQKQSDMNAVKRLSYVCSLDPPAMDRPKTGQKYKKVSAMPNKNTPVISASMPTAILYSYNKLKTRTLALTPGQPFANSQPPYDTTRPHFPRKHFAPSPLSSPPPSTNK